MINTLIELEKKLTMLYLSMSENLLNYFNKNKNRSSFYINNIAEELQLPASALVSLLEQFSEDYPSIGFYDRKTGFYKRLEKEPNTMTMKMIKISLTFLVAIGILLLSPKTIFPFTMLIAFFLLAQSAKEFMLYLMTNKAIVSRS